MLSRELMATALEQLAQACGRGKMTEPETFLAGMRKLTEDVRAGRYDALGPAEPDAVKIVLRGRRLLGLDVEIDDDLDLEGHFGAVARGGGVSVEIEAPTKEEVRWMIRGALEGLIAYRERAPRVA